MAYFSVSICLSVLVFILNGVNCQIQEPQQYSATAVPRDPNVVRQALGYNKYDGRNVKDTDKSVNFGNNWELFDGGNSANQNQGQSQYYGSQPQQPYRYY